MQKLEEPLIKMTPKATLKIDKSTLESLKRISISMEDTYDSVICRLLADRLNLILLKQEMERLKAELDKKR